MPYRLIPFVNDSFYHIFNRGVEKREIFSNSRDYEHFLETIYYYQFSGPKPKLSQHRRFKLQDFEKNPKIVEIICYCLMPNHFHLLIRQTREGGIQEFISKLINSYTRYYNTKNERTGHLFQGQFKGVLVETDEQLLHLSRYIHLNPLVSGLCSDLESFPDSSFSEFSDANTKGVCNKEEILKFFKDSRLYSQFVNDQKDYAKELYQIRHLILDD